MLTRSALIGLSSLVFFMLALSGCSTASTSTRSPTAALPSATTKALPQTSSPDYNKDEASYCASLAGDDVDSILAGGVVWGGLDGRNDSCHWYSLNTPFVQIWYGPASTFDGPWSLDTLKKSCTDDGHPGIVCTPLPSIGDGAMRATWKAPGGEGKPIELIYSAVKGDTVVEIQVEDAQSTLPPSWNGKNALERALSGPGEHLLTTLLNSGIVPPLAQD